VPALRRASSSKDTCELNLSEEAFIRGVIMEENIRSLIEISSQENGGETLDELLLLMHF